MKTKLSGNFKRLLNKRKTRQSHQYNFLTEDLRGKKPSISLVEAKALYFSAVALTEYQRNKYETHHNQKELPLAEPSGAVVSADDLQEFPNEQAIRLEFERQQSVLLGLLTEALTVLTDKQKAIVQATMAGLSQAEIAKSLGLGQTSVSKTLHGNIDYARNKRYGGALHKIQKYIIAQLMVLQEDEILKRLGVKT